MGATSSEILHLLKVKLPLQNHQRWLLLLSWFSKFFGGGPPKPPFQTSKCHFFSMQHCLVRFSTRDYTSKEKFSIDLCLDGYIFVA